MKQTVFGLVSMLLLVFFLIIAMSLYGRNLRQAETDHTLAEAVDTAMSNLMENKVYSIDTKDEFVADFLETLLVQMNSTSDVEVSILEADEKKGILSVEVTQNYLHPNGKEGTVSVVRTVIFDKEVEKQPKHYTVSFYTEDDELYKSYILPENSVCTMPLPPEKEGEVFSCWRFVTGASGTADQLEVAYGNGGGSKKVLAANGEFYAVQKDTKLIAVFE